jgi:hypothetical protein
VRGEVQSQRLEAPKSREHKSVNALSSFRAKSSFDSNTTRRYRVPFIYQYQRFNSQDYNLIKSTSIPSMTGITAHNIIGQDPLLVDLLPSKY